MTTLNGAGVCQIANSAPAQAGAIARVAAAASTNATSVKASPGVLSGGILCNNTAAAKFFKFYDKASAPTVGTDTPKFTLIIPANNNIVLDHAVGAGFTVGIAYAITGAIGDADTTVLAANDVHGYLSYA